MFRAIRLLIVLSTCMVGNVWAAESDKAPISVSHSGQDSIGQRLAFMLKETIRASAGYRLVDDKDALFQIRMVTLDPDDGPRSGVSTVVATAYLMSNYLPYEKGNPQTWRPIYLSETVSIVGADRLSGHATSILAGLDRQIENFKNEAVNDK